MPRGDSIEITGIMNSFPIVLTIAGSDNSGGAGIQADIKTCCAFKVYAASVITGVTAQNSRHVYGVEPIPAELLEKQIDSVFEAMTPDAVKTGMLPTPECIRIVSEKIRKYRPRHLIVDPVMVATNGDSLVSGNEIVSEMKRSLLPLADLVTPNRREASCLLAAPVESMTPEEACAALREICCSKAVLLKGGDMEGDSSVDWLFDGERFKKYSSKRIDSPNTHGTGCTLSSAIACGLAKGLPLHKAVRVAKDYVFHAIQKGKNIHIMDGHGPLYFFT